MSMRMGGRRPRIGMFMALPSGAFVLCSASLAAQAPAVRDSGGTRIIEHSTLETRRIAFRVQSSPALSLGGVRDDAREEFDPKHALMRAVIAPDGRIVVADYSQLKVFSSDGRLLRVLGKAGMGPGEFQQLRFVCLSRGDTIVAEDNRHQASVFTMAGRFVRSFRVDGALFDGGCLDDGTLLSRSPSYVNPSTRYSPTVAGAIDRLHDLHALDLTGRKRSSLGVYRSAMFTAFNTFPVALSLGREFIVGDGQAPHLVVRDVQGTILRIIRWRAPMQPIDREMIAEKARRAVPLGTSAGEAARRINGSLAAPHQSHLPAYRTIFADPSGRIWIEPYTNGGLTDVTVLDSTGYLLGVVQLPALGDPALRPQILAVTKDHILLRWKDDDGAVHVSLHSLAR